MSDKQAAAMAKLQEENRKRNEENKKNGIKRNITCTPHVYDKNGNRRTEDELEMMKANRGLKDTRNEIVKAQTMIQCTMPQLFQIMDYLEGVGMRSPAACVYREQLLNACDVLGDVETILIGLK